MFKRRKILLGFDVRANFAVRVQKRLPVVVLPLHPSVGPNVVSILLLIFSTRVLFPKQQTSNIKRQNPNTKHLKPTKHPNCQRKQPPNTKHQTSNIKHLKHVKPQLSKTVKHQNTKCHT